MKKLSLLLVIALMAVLAFVTTAQEEEQDLNWCSDGTWTCDNTDPAVNEVMWQCGWYFANAAAGRFSMWDVPCWCYPFMSDSDGDGLRDIIDYCPLDEQNNCGGITWEWYWQTEMWAFSCLTDLCSDPMSETCWFFW